MRLSTALLAQLVAAVSCRARCCASMGRRLASFLIVATLCLQPTSQAWTHPEPDYSILADPQRLLRIKSGCETISAALRESSATPDQGDGLDIQYECLIRAAVEEFSNHIGTEHYPAVEFEARLRTLADLQASFVIDLHVKHQRDPPYGSMWGLFYAVVQVTVVLHQLDLMWNYYDMNN